MDAVAFLGEAILPFAVLRPAGRESPVWAEADIGIAPGISHISHSNRHGAMHECGGPEPTYSSTVTTVARRVLVTCDAAKTRLNR